jgi:hypothetical protein|tara:strand:- start:270 stop:515 length:246 start_codon:yes stop_codon:yes gene_type:complete
MKESKIYKFPRKKSRYSDEWLSRMDPVGLTEAILKKEVNMPYRVGVALADYMIAKTYYDLVVDEERFSSSEPVIEGFCSEK